MMGFGDAVASAGQSAPRSIQITTVTPHNSIFTGWMLFLMPNQVSKVLKAHSSIYKERTSGIKLLLLSAAAGKPVYESTGTLLHTKVNV